MRKVAAEHGLPYETARDWWRRYRSRALVLASGLSALTVAMGGEVPALSAAPERAGLQALDLAWEQAGRYVEGGRLGLFEFASAVTGGEFLATTTNPPWAKLGRSVVMVPTPSPSRERSPPCPPTPPNRSP